MKRVLITSLAMLLLAAWSAYAVTQAQSLGNVDVSIRALTAAQVLISTSTKAGQLIYCSNCGASGGAGTICVSTGTSGYNPFVLSTGTVCK